MAAVATAEPTPASPAVKQPAICLLLAMLSGAVFGVVMHWNSFDLGDIHKPFIAMLALSWFPWALIKFHPIRSPRNYWGFAILLSFIGWDAMARIVARGMGC